MSRWPSRLLVAWVVMFVFGWVLVIVSGYGGDSGGGFFSELVWRVGGVMVYASPLVLLAAGLFYLVGRRRTAARRRGHSAIGIVSLDHVQLAAPPGCEAEARRFFGELLGLDEIEKPEPLQARGGVWFSLGTQQLHIGVEQPFSPARKAHPALRVSDRDLDRLAHTLAGAGEKVEWDSSLAEVRRFYTADPWGNRIELTGGATATS